MQTKIYLVRHTETVGNIENRLVGRKDYEITANGYNYINALTERLKNVKFDKVYSSTSDRAIKTVVPLAQINKLDIITSNKLCEMDFGDYDGFTWKEVERINPKVITARDVDWVIKYIPNQENMDDVVQRLDSYIREISEENAGKTILIASHGVAIEGFLRNITKEYFSTKKLGYSQKYTAVNILTYEKNKFSILLKANVEHINAKEK